MSNIICDSCFHNEQLQKFIRQHGRKAEDRYKCVCGAESDYKYEDIVYLLDKKELSKKLITIVNKLYIHEHDHGMGAGARNYVEGDDDPFEFAGLSDLYDVCENLFDDNTLADFIIENKPYVDISDGEEDLFESAYYKVWQHRCFFAKGNENEFGLHNWKKFCDSVKHKARYFDHKKFSVIRTLENFNEFFEQIVIDNINIDIYRARKIHSNKEKNDISTNPIKELGKVPIEYAKTNRFSPIGISYGYFAFEEETVLKEIRCEINDEVAVGKFSLNSDLKIIDFRNSSLEKEFLDYFSNNFNEKFYCIDSYIKEFITDISRPISNNKQLLEYIPTQIMSEYIWSKGYDGFLFDSSVNCGGTNLVLFEETYQFKKYNQYKIMNNTLTLEEI